MSKDEHICCAITKNRRNFPEAKTNPDLEIAESALGKISFRDYFTTLLYSPINSPTFTTLSKNSNKI